MIASHVQVESNLNASIAPSGALRNFAISLIDMSLNGGMGRLPELNSREGAGFGVRPVSEVIRDPYLNEYVAYAWWRTPTIICPFVSSHSETDS